MKGVPNPKLEVGAVADANLHFEKQTSTILGAKQNIEASLRIVATVRVVQIDGRASASIDVPGTT
jgi:hypothetical protein